jgi:hypothetical protein
MTNSNPFSPFRLPANHPNIFAHLSIPVSPLPYISPSTRTLDFLALNNAIASLPSNSVIVLQPSSNNPTGCDPSPEVSHHLSPRPRTAQTAHIIQASPTRPPGNPETKSPSLHASHSSERKSVVLLNLPSKTHSNGASSPIPSPPTPTSPSSTPPIQASPAALPPPIASPSASSPPVPSPSSSPPRTGNASACTASASAC